MHVKATDLEGNFSFATITIHVEDPAEHFAAATTCVSPSGDFDGCPAGADELTSSSLNEAATLASGDRRVLLQRGATFESSDARFAPSTAAILGAYGEGVRPVVRTEGDQPVLRVGGVGARVMDLELVSSIEEVPADGTASVIDRLSDVARESLILRVHTRNGQHGVSFVGFGSGEDIRHQVSVVDCELDDVAVRTDGSEGGKNLHELSDRHDDGFSAQYPTRDLRIYNNTCYFEELGNNPSCVRAEGDVSGDEVHVYDNLVYSPNAELEATDGPMDAGFNPVWGPGDGSPFLEADPSAPGDFSRTFEVIDEGAGANLEAHSAWRE